MSFEVLNPQTEASMPSPSRAAYVPALVSLQLKSLSCALLLLLVFAASVAVAQQDDQSVTTIKKDVNVVNVLATVRNKQGQIVSTLNKDEFKLEVDGKPQAIKYFSRVAREILYRLRLPIHLELEVVLVQRGNDLALFVANRGQYVDDINVLLDGRDRLIVLLCYCNTGGKYQ